MIILFNYHLIVQMLYLRSTDCNLRDSLILGFNDNYSSIISIVGKNF